MVEQIQTGGGSRAASAANANDPTDQNNFHIIHNFFRDRFNKYFSGLSSSNNSSFLIIEESLSQVIKFLLSPVDASLKIRGFGMLCDHTVSLTCSSTFYSLIHRDDISCSENSRTTTRVACLSLHCEAWTGIRPDGHRVTFAPKSSRY